MIPDNYGIQGFAPKKQSVDILKKLPRILSAAGYSDVFNLYGSLNFQIDKWEQDLHLLPKDLQTLFKLFLLGRTVQPKEIHPLISLDETEALQELSVLCRDPSGGLHTGNLIVIPVFGYFMLLQRPGVNPMVYYGEDSAALVSHLSPGNDNVCLDLCAGPGIQSLVCSGRAKKVFAVEINPLTASFAELNVVLNSLEDKIEVRNGDLYEAIGQMQFDFICANPPLLPFPSDLPYPFVGHGGDDGLGITRRILNGLDMHLAENGVCQIIGTCLGDKKGPLCEEEMAQFAQRGYKIIMTVPTAISLQSDSPFFKKLVWSCAAGAALDFNQVAERYAMHLRKLNATHLNLFFLFITKTNCGSEFTVTRHYLESSGFWNI